MRKSKMLSVATSATLVAAMLLTGCGGDSGESSSATPSSDVSAAAGSESTGGNSGSESSGGSEESNLLPALSDS